MTDQTKPNLLPSDVRQWFYYPIEMPLTEDGQGPATVGKDAARITYEVWDVLLNTHGSFDNLPDAINEAMRLNMLSVSPSAQEHAVELPDAGPVTQDVAGPERIRVAQDADGFWTCREAVSGSQEYVRADLLTSLAAENERLRSQVREQALKSIADLGQAQEAWEAQLKAEAERDALAAEVKALRSELADMKDEWEAECEGRMQAMAKVRALRRQLADHGDDE